jgi:hypothetical protein
VLGGNSTIFYSYPSTVFTDALDVAHASTQIISVPSDPGSSTRATLLAQAQGFDKVLIVSMEWKPYLNKSSQITLVNNMISAGVPLAYVSFGSPYQWNLFPALQNFLCGFSSHYATQQEMVKVVLGQSEAGSNWPVQLNQLVSHVADWALY